MPSSRTSTTPPGVCCTHATAFCINPRGFQRLAGNLMPGGIFGLWSPDPPDDDFRRMMSRIFASIRAHGVKFYNPLLNRDEVNTVYVARKAES